MEGEATNAPFLRKDERFKSILLGRVRGQEFFLFPHLSSSFFSSFPLNLHPPPPLPNFQTCAQVNQNLRSFGSMSRNDVQCMMYNHPDGLPTTIRSGLNQKVDQLLKVSRCAQGTHVPGRQPILMPMG